jgi:RimJ/RimL family protein N-acetyltransferase
MKQIVIGRPVVEWVAARTGEYGNFGAAVGFGVEESGKLVGGVAFNDYNGASIQIHTASEKVAWLNRRFLWMIFDYAFNQAKVNLIISLVGEKNQRAINIGRDLGFKQIHAIPDAHPEGLLLIRTMRRSECKWLALGKRYGHQTGVIEGRQSLGIERPLEVCA